jgi:hypothetical protein
MIGPFLLFLSDLKFILRRIFGCALRFFWCLGDFFECGCKGFQAGNRDVAELSSVQFFYRSVKLSQDFQTLRGDTRLYYAAIVELAHAGNQAALFHAVEQAGHIGVVGNHAVADALAGQTIGLGAAQDAQNVVLSPGQGVLLHQLFGLLAEAVGGDEQGDEDSGFEGWGGTFLRSGDSHECNYSRHNDYCQEESVFAQEDCGARDANGRPQERFLAALGMTAVFG